MTSAKSARQLRTPRTPQDKPIEQPRPGKRGASRKFTAKREAIIAAGSDIINHQGVKGMTLASVAEAVGLSTTSITYYFKLKEELAAACIIRGIERLEAVTELAAQEGDPGARASRFIQLYFEVFARMRQGLEPPLCVFNDIKPLSQINAISVLKAHVRMFQGVRAMLAGSVVTEANRRKWDSRTLLFLATIYWIPLWITSYDLEDHSRVASRMTDLVLNGLTGPKHAGQPLPTPLRFRDPGARDQKELFLIAATELINEQGYHGASIDKISARLDVTKGSFYHHLDTKDDLIALCFSRTFDIMASAQRAAMTVSADGWTQLATACVSLAELQFSSDGPLLAFSAFTALPPEMISETVRQSERIPRRFSEMISDGVIDGSIRPVDTFIAAQMVTAMISSISELPNTAPGVEAREAVDLFARPLLFGLLND
jgi:AcrR family transcriptional regulator